MPPTRRLPATPLVQRRHLHLRQPLPALDLNGQRYSHIIDPRTGMALTDHSLITVIAPDDFTADGLTKVMSVLPLRDARQFIARVPGASVRIVRQPGAKIEVYESKSFRRYYQ